MKGIKILGTGLYAPEKIITNDDFAKIVDTTDEWIYTRTGMKERHISDGEPTWFMATEAAKKAIAKAGIDVQDIDAVIISTITADYVTPSCACLVQRELGIERCMAVDVNAACAGFVYGVDMARAYLACGDIKNALVIGSENLTKIIDYSDRGSCVLFGDGAAAAVISSSDNIYSSHISADGAGAKHMVARGTPPQNAFIENKIKFDEKMPESNGHYLFMDGKEVYKFATNALPLAVREACKKIDIEVEDIDLIIPHQANIRIIQTAAQKLKVSMDKLFVNIDKYGNTSSASIPIALTEAYESGRIKSGDKICLVGFGSGLTYGAVIFEA